MKRHACTIGVVASLFFLIAAFGGTGYAKEPVHLRFSSHVIGGTGYTQMALLAKQLRPHLPEGSTIDVLPYSGGIGNIKLIEAGKAEYGIGLTASDRWAIDGKVVFKKKYKKLRHIGTTDIFYICVYATQKSKITSLEKLLTAKKPVRWFALNIGATGEVATRLLLQGYGASYDKIKAWGGKVTNTGWVNIGPALRDGRGDLVSHGVGAGHPSMTEIAVTVNGRFLDLKESVRDMFAKEYGFDKVEMPANTFKHQPKPLKTVAYYITIVASADIPDDLAYLTAKILAEERKDLIKGHKSFKALPPEASCWPGKSGAPFHPGAERYYKERGWIK
jgi:TRAP transporter TAXI family solute receptor